MVPRQWIISLWRFNAIKQNLDELNNIGKTSLVVVLALFLFSKFWSLSDMGIVIGIKKIAIAGLVHLHSY